MKTSIFQTLKGSYLCGPWSIITQIITLSVAMETSGRIGPNFKLIQASMHVLIACKYEKDQIKKSGENVMTTFSPL